MTSPKGTDRELYICEKYKKLGFHTMRSYASLGIYDFIAFRKAICCPTCTHDHSEILIIQVKGNPWDKPDFEGLTKLAKEIGGRAVVVYRETRVSVLGKGKKNGKWITVYLDSLPPPQASPLMLPVAVVS